VVALPNHSKKRCRKYPSKGRDINWGTTSISPRGKSNLPFEEGGGGTLCKKKKKTILTPEGFFLRQREEKKKKKKLPREGPRREGGEKKG